MSRKPTAINLSGAEAEPEKPAQKARSQSQQETAKPATKSSRKPKALPAPKFDKANEQEDYFDQSPFVDEAVETSPPTHVPKKPKGIGWISILLSALGLLFSIVIVYRLQNLVTEFFAVHPSLGWVVFGLSITAGVALLFLIMREISSLFRLRKLKSIREESEQVLLGLRPAEKTVNAISNLYRSREDMRWHLDKLASYQEDIIDGPDRLLLVERHVLSPLDQEAKQVIASSAKRISVITAINPSPVLDILFVGFQILRMLRQVMAIYGGRPALFGALKLVKMIAAHLAVTGGLALSDTILQQFLGKGLAGRLSSKLGEGTVNGIMATRIGLAAMDLCRPMPFTANERPNLKSFLGELFSNNF